MTKAKADKPVAIIGSGHAGLAALVNKLVEISEAPDTGTPTTIVLIDTKDPQPKSTTLYPLNGKRIDEIHPFPGKKPPLGYPTFGEYVRENLPDDPGLKTALRGTPTYGQVTDYMNYLVDLAQTVADTKAELIVDKRTLENKNQRARTTPGEINFTTGSPLEVSSIIRGEQPPHMSAPNAANDKPPAASAESSKPRKRSASPSR